VHHAIGFSDQEQASLNKVIHINMCGDPDWTVLDYINTEWQVTNALPPDMARMLTVGKGRSTAR
jgi:hypothetical protein